MTAELPDVIKITADKNLLPPIIKVDNKIFKVKD